MRSNAYGTSSGVSPHPQDPSSRSSTVAEYNSSLNLPAHNNHSSTQRYSNNPRPYDDDGRVGGGQPPARGGLSSVRVHQDLVSQITTGPLFPSPIHPSTTNINDDSPASPSVSTSVMRSGARSRYDPATGGAVDASSFVLGDGSSFLPERSYSRMEPPTPLSQRGHGAVRQTEPQPRAPQHMSQRARREDPNDDDYLDERRSQNYRAQQLPASASRGATTAGGGGGNYYDQSAHHAVFGRSAAQEDELQRRRHHRRQQDDDIVDDRHRGDSGSGKPEHRSAAPRSPRAPSLEQLGTEQLQTRCLMLASCLEHTTTERDALSEVIGNLTSYRDTLLNDIFQLREANKDILSGKESAEKAVGELTEELRRCASLVDTLRDAKQRGDDTAQHASLSIDVLQRSNRVLESDRDQLTAEVAALRGQRSELEHQVASLARELTEKNERLEEARRELDEAKIIETQMERMVVERDEEVDKEREQHTSVSRERASLHKQLHDALEREVSLQKTLDRLNHANEELRADMRKILEQGQRDANVAQEMKSEVAVLKARESEWIAHREALEIQRGTAQGSSEQLIQRCQELREQVARLEVKLDAAQEHAAKLQTSEAELRTKNTFAEERAAAVREAADNEKRIRDDLEQRLATAESAVTACEEELTTLREELFATKEALVNTSDTLDATRRELDSSKISLAADEEHREEVLAAHEAVVREMDHSRGALQVRNDQLEGLLALVSDFHHQIAQTTTIAMSQRDYAHQRLLTVEEEGKVAKVALDQEVDAKVRATAELQHSREAQNALHTRLEQLESVLEQTTDMLSATRQDRDLLVNEMRRSQQLWMNMSDQQRVQRSIQQTGRPQGSPPGVATSPPSQSHPPQTGGYLPVFTQQQQQHHFHDDGNHNVAGSTSSTPLSPVITGVTHTTSL